ncbi:MAG: hypothetical protein OZ923_13040 [Comamonadaceae bacterium]|nr:hypothetical protein [Burkholderiales bacterium]MEB2349522.1 hypothetical protein [Comamonadaceae bacterium]
MGTNQESETNANGENTLGRIWSFLNRDVRSFLPLRKPEPSVTPKTQEPAEPQLIVQEESAPPPPPVLPLTRPDRLRVVEFERKVLDWRDKAHIDITSTMDTQCRSLIDEMDRELDRLGFLGRWFADPASEVLSHQLEALIRAPMTKQLGALQAELYVVNPPADPGLGNRPNGSLFNKARLAQHPAGLKQVPFKPSAREEIVRQLRAWILEPDGLAPHFCAQATKIGAHLLEEHGTC